ncbi:MAG: hypothetical protein IJ825_00500 [Oscillospiraceae bacterium]|nr:hypothetical protein [Oscillospiraceae bacterium]
MRLQHAYLRVCPVRARTFFFPPLTKVPISSTSTIGIALAIPEDQVIGDLNFDGVFDLRDVILMNRYLVCQAQFSARQFAAADLTGDGQADIFDLAVFKHMLLQ